MKKILTPFLLVVLALGSNNVWAYSVFVPPGNLVQNGSFQLDGTYWSGAAAAYLGNWPSVPNDFAALAQDLYQNIPTSPGQKYAITFYAAADLYFAPSVTFTVALNQQPLVSFVTPARAYDPQVNRIDQMPWEQYKASFVASGSTTRLEFIDQNTFDFGLTGVSMVAVPEPTSVAFGLVGGAAVIGVCKKRKRSIS